MGNSTQPVTAESSTPFSPNEVLRWNEFLLQQRVSYEATEPNHFDADMAKQQQMIHWAHMIFCQGVWRWFKTQADIKTQTIQQPWMVYTPLVQNMRDFVAELNRLGNRQLFFDWKDHVIYVTFSANILRNHSRLTNNH